MFCFFSGSGIIYVINEVDGTLETAHKLQVSTKNFPGTFYNSQKWKVAQGQRVKHPR